LVSGPCLTSVAESGEGTDGADNLGWVLEELYTETTGDMEWNMAMHQPCTWVVSWEADDDVSTSVCGVGITTDGVVQVIGSCASSGATCNDPLKIY
jgi:hypothetical protein